MTLRPLPFPTVAPPSLRTLVVRVGGPLVAAAATLVALRSFDLGAVAATLEGARPSWLLAAVVVVLAQLLLRAVRLRSLLPRPADGHVVGVGSLVAAMLGAWFVNNLTPARIGDGVKCYVVARRHGMPFSGVLGTIALEHGLDAPALAVVASVMAVVAGLAGPWRAATTLAGAAGLAILVLLFAADLGRLGRGLRRRMAAGPRLVARVAAALGQFGTGSHVAGRRRLVAVGLLVGLAASLGDALALWLVGGALGIPLSVPAAVLIAAAVALSTVLPGAPGYVGTLELAAVTAAGALGIVGPGALALALAFHVVQFAPLAVLALVVVATGAHGARLPAASELMAAGRTAARPAIVPAPELVPVPALARSDAS